MTNSGKADNAELLKVEGMVSKCLLVGVILSAAIILTGLLMYIVTGNSGYPGSSYPVSLAEVFSGAVKFKPYAIILSGLFILILTPVFRVAVSVIAFWKERDYLYMIITLIVLAILITGFSIGKVA
jgi:uncharacterized membrane protein